VEVAGTEEAGVGGWGEGVTTNIEVIIKERPIRTVTSHCKRLEASFNYQRLQRSNLNKTKDLKLRQIDSECIKSTDSGTSLRITFLWSYWIYACVDLTTGLFPVGIQLWPNLEVETNRSRPLFRLEWERHCERPRPHPGQPQLGNEVRRTLSPESSETNACIRRQTLDWQTTAEVSNRRRRTSRSPSVRFWVNDKCCSSKLISLTESSAAKVQNSKVSRS